MHGIGFTYARLFGRLTMVRIAVRIAVHTHLHKNVPTVVRIWSIDDGKSSPALLASPAALFRRHGRSAVVHGRREAPAHLATVDLHGAGGPRIVVRRAAFHPPSR